MKKNLMTVIILALVFANFVLTAILMFTVLPQTQKANELITKVCEAIDLELNSGAASGLSNLPIEQIATYKVGAGEKMNVNLAGGNNIAQIAVSISVNKESQRYKDSEMAILTENEDTIKNAIIQTVRQYSKDEFLKNTEAIQDEICQNLQKTFGKEFIVGVSFPTQTVQ